MKIFLIALLSIAFSLLTYFKNFNLPLFLLRTFWLFFILNIIFNPIYIINLTKKTENVVIFDTTESMKYNEKLNEAKEFLNKIKGGYKLFYLNEENEDELIEKIKEIKLSKILLISDGYLSKKFKNFLENIGIKIDVFIFPNIEPEENLEVQIPSFVQKNEEFLVEMKYYSTESVSGKIKIKGDGVEINKDVSIKKGMNYYNFKFLFKKPGIKKIQVTLFASGRKFAKDYKIEVKEPRPVIALFSRKPLPLIKLLKDFLIRNVREDVNTFVEISKNDIRKINEKVEKREIPDSVDWLVIISPQLSEDYAKNIKAHRIVYFYEDFPSIEVKSKGVFEGKNFYLEVPLTSFRIASVRIKGDEMMELRFPDKNFPIMLNRNNETHFLLSNLFQIIFPLDEKIRDLLFSYIFRASELKNPEIVYPEIPEIIRENEEFFIKSKVLTSLLEPAYDSHVFLQIGKEKYSMIYEGEGSFISPPLRMKAGKYEFEIIAQRERFSRTLKGKINILSSEFKRDVDREYLLFLAGKTGGREVKGEYEFKPFSYRTEKYLLNLRKNILSYILIVLIFSIEIFFRKREGFL